MPDSGPSRLIAVELDPASIGRGAPEVEHERKVAITDLMADGHIDPVGQAGGDYRLYLAVIDEKLTVSLDDQGGTRLAHSAVALAPIRKLVRDYFLICDSYYAALRTATPEQIEAIDMGRRSLHDEGSSLLKDRLAEQMGLDFDTARRLFTLVCALLWKG